MYTRGQTLQETIHDTGKRPSFQTDVNIIYGPVFKTEFVLIMINGDNNNNWIYTATIVYRYIFLTLEFMHFVKENMWLYCGPFTKLDVYISYYIL